jgi:BlaI family transcriptional regulator, penicillinase repressor
MARPASEHPTELELAILKILWRQAPQTVEQVRDLLARDGRELAHSSVITIMNIMVRKGLLAREKQGRAFEFTPLVAEADVGQGMLADLVDRVFDGSATAVLMNLLEAKDVNADELRELRKLLQRKEKELDK